MKTHHTLDGKNPLPLLILLMLTLSILSALSVNVKVVSAEELPFIYMEPAYTDATLTLGTNFTVSIKTNYTGADILGWQFTLSYNPFVLHGVEVVNGDLITKDRNATAMFLPGTFNNTEGKLSLTGALFFDTIPQDGVDVTYGPGTLANVTFTVVGYGATPIAFGRGPSETILQGWNATPTPEYPYGQGYLIIDAETMPNQVIDGYLINVQSIHDVAIAALNTPSQVIVGQTAQINVTIANEGNYTENGNLTLQYNTILIDTKPFTLNRGEYKTIPFNWNTTGINPGNYTLNATATIPVDADPTDNTKTTSVELKLAPDVAVTSITAPTAAALGETVPINVTVVNEGSFDESVNVTLTYDDTLIDFQIKNITAGDLAIIEFNWNTTDLALDTYTLNATAIIPLDEDLSDNALTTQITLNWGYDLAVKSIRVTPYKVEVGETANITVTILNNGVYNATNFNVAVTYDTNLIENQSIPLLSSGEQKSVSFIWNTTGVDPGLYTITAEAILATDEDLTNNNRTSPIVLIVPPVASFTFSPTSPVVGEVVLFNATASNDPDGEIVSYAWNFGDGTTAVYVKDENLTAVANHTYTAAGTYTVTLTVTDKDDLTDIAVTNVTVIIHDIAITNVTAFPDTAKIGESISINVTVMNEGTEKETFTVTVYYDNTTIGTQSITELASGASQLLTFSWDTSNVTAGTYIIKAVATPVADETDTNDNTFTDVTVTIEKVPTQDILIYVAVAGAVIIILVAVAIYLLKVRKPT